VGFDFNGLEALAMDRRVLSSLIGVCGVGLGIFVQCSSDEDTTVDIATACEVGKLRDDVAEKTVKLFVETANEFDAKTKDLERRFTEVCKKINRDSGDSEGSDLRGACNKIAARLAKAAKIPDAGTTPVWVAISFDPTCNRNTQAELACIPQCAAGPCDPAKACPPDKQQGTCSGKCTGVCLSTDSACTGECHGACAMPDGGTGCQTAECVGGCSGATWTGRCEQGCDQTFNGVCGGTCVGTCDGNRVGPTPPTPDGGSDAGTEAGTDAGPPPIVPAPGGADGNCPGVCVGTCSSQASGTCRARCRGGFSGGECFAGGARCTGACLQGSLACLTSCTGKCASPATNSTCQGECQGTCDVPMTGVKCTVPPSCEATAECKNICAVKGALATTCEAPSAVDVRLAGDNPMYAALKKHIAEFAALSMEATLLSDTSASITGASVAEYKAIGATRDRARVCVTAGAQTVDEARTRLASIVGAKQVIRGIQF
jgi:hypothetical protein